MSKTILFAINDLSFGGGQMTLVEEANRLFRKGFEVYVLTLLFPKSEENFASNLKIPSENITNIPFRSLWDLGAFIKLVKFLKSIRPDFVFSNLFFANTLIRIAKVFYSRMRVIIREGNLVKEKGLFAKVVDSMLASLTYKVIVNAKAIQEDFRKLPISQKKFTLIYNGIDEKFFLPPGESKNELRRKLDISQNAFVLINIASLTKKKGHHYLIEAMAKIKKIRNLEIKKFNRSNFPISQFPNFLLLLVGDGPERKNLEFRIQNLGLQNNVKLLGARKNIKELLGVADAFVLSSLWEGMPNAMLEAMAAGVPVVAAAVGGITEIVNNRKNGLVVQPKDADGLASAIGELIDNPTLRAELGAAARQSVRSWTWDNHVSRLVEILE